jgi:hypothetical protein
MLLECAAYTEHRYNQRQLNTQKPRLIGQYEMGMLKLKRVKFRT